MNIDLKTLTEHATVTNALCLAGSLVFLKYYENIWWLIQTRRSPLRRLAGPSGGSAIVGHILQLNKEETTDIHERWFENYGKVLHFKGFLGVRS